uniref:Uncharacterized protein n=1 Tax=Triticum urartu TaxID=4572 RepID=A0A8R7K088_TRIUA
MQRVYQMHQSDISVQHRLLRLTQLTKMGFHSIYLEATTDFESMAFPGLRGMACWHHSQLDVRAMMCICWLLGDLRVLMFTTSTE